MFAFSVVSVLSRAQILRLPREIGFTDYSSIAVRGNRLAITSQEDSVVWIGRFNAPEETPEKREAGTGEGPDKHKRKMLVDNPLDLEVLAGAPSRGALVT